MAQENERSTSSREGQNAEDTPSESSGRGHFPETRWPLVLEMQHPDSTRQGVRALNELCQLYWHPVYAYVRSWRKSPADAEDLTQGFFSMLLARKSLDFVSPDKGKLRTFLLVSLKRYLATDHERASAQKRGRGEVPLSLDFEWAEGHFHPEAATHTTPDLLFDRQWALTVLDHVLSQLRERYESEGKLEVFDALRSTISLDGAKRLLAEVAAELGMTEGAAKVAAHRLRRRYRKLLEDTIAETVGSEDSVKEEILEMIGRGGMGAVFKARQASLDRYVALKVLPEEWNASANFRERFEREAKTLAALNHPNIVTIHEFGERAGRFFFTMEFVDGTDLERMIRGGEMASDQALGLIPQICEAIQFAHDRGVVHRDIKPANILVGRDGRVKVADFGIVKLGKGSEHNPEAEETTNPQFDLTAPRGRLGTPRYMAPEQAAASGELDHRADLYALGVVFYEMLVGSLPAKGKLVVAPSLSGKVDRRRDRIILRALEEDPARRYQNATEIKTAVESVLAEQRRWIPGWAKAVAAAAILAGLFFLWPWPDEAEKEPI